MKYDIKIDLWIKLLFYGTVVVLVFPVFMVPVGEVLFYMFSTLPIIVMIFWIMLGSSVKLNEEELYIKLGFISRKIKYSNIKSISLSKNWQSSYALTSDRITIKIHDKNFFKGDVQIGPKDKNEFSDALKRRCRNLD